MYPYFRRELSLYLPAHRGFNALWALSLRCPFDLMKETFYSARSPLASPRGFARRAWDDLRISPVIARVLFTRNLRAQHRQSWLGYAWLLLGPLAVTLTWVYLNAANIINVGPTALPYPVHVLAGTLLWQLFVESINGPLQQFGESNELITKARVPHEAILLSGVLQILFNFGVRLILLLGVLFWFAIPLQASLFLVPLGVGALLALGLALGLLLAPLGLLYQDVGRGLGLLLGFWFFVTPVVYPAPKAWPASLLVGLNPVTPLLVTTRDWLTGRAAAASGAFALTALVGALLLVFSWLIYRLARPHLVARL